MRARIGLGEGSNNTMTRLTIRTRAFALLGPFFFGVAKLKAGLSRAGAAYSQIKRTSWHDFKFGKRYVPEKEYIHMISSYITADWSNIE